MEVTQTAPAEEVKAETAAAPEATEHSEVKTEETKPAELPRGVQKRIDKLTARLRDAESKLAEAAKPAEADDKEPKIEDFDFDSDKYEEAKIAYRVRKELSNAEKAKLEASERQKQQKVIESAKVKFDEAGDRFDDFDDVVYKNPYVTNDMVQAVFFSDVGPDIAYYLGKNPEESQRIAALPAARQMIEIGKLEARFTTKPEPRTTNAPEPIKPVSSAGKAPSMLSDDMPLADWMKLRQQQARR